MENLLASAYAVDLPFEPSAAPIEGSAYTADGTSAFAVDRALEQPVSTVERSALDAALKRAFDLVVASLAFLVLAPLWLLIALMIKVDSPGPILFRQSRVGRNGEIFSMLKFRTMIPDAEAQKLTLLHLNDAADGLFKLHADPRVTRFGRLLRSTSLDELPQLIHVLTGRMSLVGPRPLVPDESVQIKAKYRQRFGMRPGMTGVWQVAGASRVPINEMAELDLAYVETWSLWSDVKVLFGTAKHVLYRRGI